MQFVVTGYDGDDAQALERRLHKREEHLKLAEKMKSQGRLLFATALLDENEKMVGSILVVDFANRDDVDAWLKTEPYVTGKVWLKVDVRPCRVAPMFQPA
ncbi:MAG: YciI family protein [Candidatus Obscuribacterales bacterium]|nr:YciI family protein [Candidatus Obscuribacterales bacterium]